MKMLEIVSCDATTCVHRAVLNLANGCEDVPGWACVFVSGEPSRYYCPEHADKAVADVVATGWPPIV